jgi:hypothetical protein
MFRRQKFTDVLELLAASIIVALMMEAASTFEKSVNFYQTKQHNISEETVIFIRITSFDSAYRGKRSLQLPPALHPNKFRCEVCATPYLYIHSYSAFRTQFSSPIRWNTRAENKWRHFQYSEKQATSLNIVISPVCTYSVYISRFVSTDVGRVYPTEFIHSPSGYSFHTDFHYI